ncbi:unnamed protein product [Sphagnum jensenii]
MPRTKSAAKQAKQKLTHAELSAIHKAKWAKIRENIAAKKAEEKEVVQTSPAPSGLEAFVGDENITSNQVFYETKTYDDGTIATGVAPLPEKSPAEQEPNLPPPPSQPNVPRNPQPEQPPAVPESGKTSIPAAIPVPQPVPVAPRKPKKYTGPKEFSVALKTAESRLAKATIERSEIGNEIVVLQARHWNLENKEIPSLLQLINSLKGLGNNSYIPAAPYDLSGSVPNATAFQAPMPTGFPTGIMTRDQIEADNLAKIQAAMNAAQSFPVSKAIGSVQLAPEVIGSFDDNEDEDKFITGDAAGGSGWIGG